MEGGQGRITRASSINVLNIRNPDMMNQSNISLYAFGNGNNLSWMMLYGAWKYLGLQSVLISLEKNKLRDKPPLEVTQIRHRTLSHLNCLEDTILSLSEDQNNKSIVAINSGEFLFYTSKIKKLLGERCMTIASPIGYEIETIIDGEYRKDREKYKILCSQMKLNDHLIQSKNTSNLCFQHLDMMGLWNRRIDIGSEMHPIRVGLTNDLLKLNSNYAHKPKVLPERYIFIATRITSSSGHSLNNKGSNALLSEIIKHKKLISELNYSIALVCRDQLAIEYAAKLERVFERSSTKIIKLNDLKYQQFLQVLRYATISIDAFDLDGTLRPHMTTSDAISVCTPVITSSKMPNEVWKQMKNLNLVYTANEFETALIAHANMVQRTPLREWERFLNIQLEAYTDLGEAKTIMKLV